MKRCSILNCKISFRYHLYWIVFSFLALTIIQCDTGNDPQDPPRVLISLKDPRGQFVTNSVVIDTIGNTANVRIVLHNCPDIKMLRIQIMNLQDNSIEYDTLYNFISCAATDSLITLSRVCSTAGNKEISAVATMGDFTTKGVSIRFTVIQRPFVNKAPEIDATGMKSITYIQTCTLTVNVKDDDGQKNSVIVKYHNADYLLDLNGQFVVKPKPGFVGTDSVEIVATDNYAVPLSSKEIVIINILAPELTVTKSDTAVPMLEFSKVINDSVTVTTSKTTITATVKDDTGVDSVIAINGTTTVTVKVTKVNDTTWSIETGTLPANTTIPFVVTAYDKCGKKNSKNIFVRYTPLVIDNKAPEITFLYPSLDTMSVSATSINVKVKCVDETALDSVIATMGLAKFVVAAGTGNEYTIEVSGLVTGKNKLDILAKDKAGNSTPKTITINYDPTLADNVKPGVTLLYPEKQDIRITTDTITVKINCSDQSGIADVKASLAGVALSVAAADPVYSVKLTGLTAGKCDTVLFTVSDKSTAKNTMPFQVIIRCNRVPSALTLTAPLDGATGVTANAALSWTGGVDPDSDPVTYTVKFGTSLANLNKVVTATSITGTILGNLSFNTKYYWMVVAKTPVNGDSVESSVNCFTIVEDKPVIVKEPENQYVVTGNRATFSITVQGSNLKYQWYRDTILIPEAIESTYSTPNVTAIYDSIPYRCVVSNDGGVVKSCVARLIIKYTITYMGNGNTGGTVPVDANLYSKGENAPIQKNSGNLTCTGYMFGGWNTKSTSTGVTYNPSNTVFLPLTTNIVLYAYWIPVYTITFDGQGATNEIYPITKFTNENSALGILPSTPTKTSYVFAGWWALPNGEGLQINEKTVFSASGTVYAKWEIRDVDGNLYTEVKLGDQVWMVENLKVTKYRDKIPIPKMSLDKDYWQPGYCWYDNDSATYIEPHGALYNWNVVDSANSHKVAPDGWHVPSDTEWTELVIYLSNNGYTYDGSKSYNYIGKSLAATTLWDTEKGEGKIGFELNKNNRSGFTAYPSGNWGIESSFCCIGKRCYWWSASINKNENGNEDQAFVRCLDYYYEYLERTTSSRWDGASIRCVRDW